MGWNFIWEKLSCWKDIRIFNFLWEQTLLLVTKSLPSKNFRCVLHARLGPMEIQGNMQLILFKKPSDFSLSMISIPKVVLKRSP